MGFQLAARLRVQTADRLPKGTRLIGISHFDNSPANKYNPDPAKEVRWGLQNWEEMSNCFIGLVFDARIDPKKIFTLSGPSLRPVGPPGPTLAAQIVGSGVMFRPDEV